MKIGHTYDVQSSRPLHTSEKNQTNPLMKFFHELFRINNSSEEKRHLEQIFEPRPKPAPLVRRNAEFFDNPLNK